MSTLTLSTVDSGLLAVSARGATRFIEADYTELLCPSDPTPMPMAPASAPAHTAGKKASPRARARSSYPRGISPGTGSRVWWAKERSAPQPSAAGVVLPGRRDAFEVRREVVPGRCAMELPRELSPSRNGMEEPQSSTPSSRQHRSRRQRVESWLMRTEFRVEGTLVSMEERQWARRGGKGLRVVWATAVREMVCEKMGVGLKYKVPETHTKGTLSQFPDMS